MRLSSSDIVGEIIKAEHRIRNYIRETPVEYSPHLSSIMGAEVYLKLENMQVTGSFKIRGVLNKLLSLSPEERRRGVVTASTGNHGAALAYAASILGIRGVVVLPKTVPEDKVRDIEAYGAEIIVHGTDSLEAELYARRHAVRHGMTYVSPYNDIHIIAGQGTIALELLRQLGSIDAVLVPVGGGGLISGIAGYLKGKGLRVDIYGCQPSSSAVMYESLRAGRVVQIPYKPTLADGVAGGVEPGSITLELCRRYVDGFYLVEEGEIADAIKLMVEYHHMLVEGAAALPIAGLIKSGDTFKGRRAVLIVTGRRIGLKTLRHIMCS